MATPTKTIDSRRCSVCGQPATAPDVKYMEPRCLEHAHTLRPPRTGREEVPQSERRAFWDLPPLRPDVQMRKPGMSPAFQADYGGLELRVLAHSLEQLAWHIAYEMSRITPIDMPTARALVDAAARVLTSKGPVKPEELRQQQKHIGYMVCSDGRYMFWPVEDLQVARTYCEDNVEPVKLMADVAELSKHEEGQV